MTEQTTITDQEPPKVGPDGFLNPAWTAWEWRVAERRLTGVRRPSEATRNMLARFDAAIEDAALLVQRVALKKRGLAEEIDKAAAGADRRFLAGGIVVGGKPNIGLLQELRQQHAAAVTLLDEAKQAEVALRVQRNEFPSGQSVARASTEVRVPEDQSRPYSYSDDKIVDGKVRR